MAGPLRHSVPRPRRPKLGQHFLADPAYRRRILQSLAIQSDDLVIEIGAGTGAMTKLLAERAARVVAIELDASLVEKLKDKFRGEPRVEVLEADILSSDIAAICRSHGAEKCFVFGNLPYYITSPILHHLFEFRSSIRAIAVLVQREVAGRLTAAPGSREYGYLSVLVQLHSQPRALFTVPPGAFAPPPKVQSRLVEFSITPKFPKWEIAEDEKFLDFAKRCFAQKRKNLLNNLSRTYSRRRLEQVLTGLGVSTTVRAEQLKIQQLASILEAMTDG